MNQLQNIFHYNGSRVRTIIRGGEPWFVARDVCDVLEIVNSTRATAGPSDNQKGIHKVKTPGGEQDMIVINEPGLYKLVFRSNKPEAEKFTDWVASEVIPSIRKTGSYSVQQHQLPQTFSDALRALADEVEKNERLEMRLVEQAPKVALYDTAMQAKNAQPMNAVAKTLGVGRNTLFAFLREKKVLMANNLPYQEYLDRGYFEVRQYTITHLTSGMENKTQTMVTPKGMAYIHRLLQEKEGSVSHDNQSKRIAARSQS